jgi:hypothetical protein
MKIFLEKALFVNRAPFERIDIDFNENEIAVLSAVNGKGKTTILSHIVDAFYEMVRPNFSDYEDKRNKYYRVSTPTYNLDQKQPSFVYLRFKTVDGTVSGNIDYVDIRNLCTEEQYNTAIMIENKIPFGEIIPVLSEASNIKKVSANVDAPVANKIFSQNILTYFPSYRYEAPGYLNDAYKIELSFKKESDYSGFLNNPIEVVSGLPSLANWFMDIVLDANLEPQQRVFISSTLQNLSTIITQTLISKGYGQLRLGIGPRGLGGTRVQITTLNGMSIYPSVFNLSSGEASVLCIFGELLKQADRNKNNISLQEITGVILIDEIDKHLHIKLQKETLPLLLNLFPNVQFIVSSHSPFLSMGLAETARERSKIIDLDNFGITKDATTNAQYTEVYNMMVSENGRFKENYESLRRQIDASKRLQIVTEGRNTAHIKKAIEILDSSLIANICFIEGIEDKSGAQQLKNSFDVMSKANHTGKFLFVWDCDAKKEADKAIEAGSFFKFLFPKNEANTKVKIGIENLYPLTFFDGSVYDNRGVVTSDYGEETNGTKFNKSRFLEKVQRQTSQSVFENYRSLVAKINEIINSN